MAQRKKSRGHRHPGTAAGLSGISVTHAQTRVLHSVDAHPPSTTHDGSIWGRRRVLLLNSTYEPLTALPMRRAVIMLMCGKATVVHDDPNGPVIHSASRSIVVPSVIRLHSYVRVPYRARVPMTRAALMHRDRFRCAYCGAKANTVRRRLSTFAAFHKQHRIASDPRSDVKVKAAWGRIRDAEDRRADRKLAVAESELHRIIAAMDEDFEAFTGQDRRVTLSYLRDRALLLLEYAGCLTRSEIETLSIDNAVFSGSSLRVRVNSSGEMLEDGKRVWVNPRRTRDVEIRRADDPTYCGVVALRKWVKAAAIVDGSVFRGVLIRGALTERLTARAIHDAHEHRAGCVGLDKHAVSSHSIRTGRLATTAYRGASDETLRELAGLQCLNSVADVVSRSRSAARAGRPITLV